MMKFGEFLEKAFFYLSVPKCVSCKERLSRNERALCGECLDKSMEAMERECPMCLKSVTRCLCANKYLETHFVKGHIKLYKYGDSESAKPLNSLIYQIKQGRREDAFDFLASELAKATSVHGINLDNALITYVPRRRSAILRYGIDHARVLAERVALLLSVECMRLLTSTAKTAQKSLAGAERIANTNYTVVSEPDLSQRTVIIVDDIVTTGASMGSAAMLVRSMGAKDIYALSVGYAYKQNKED